jgi:prepilin-type processing-associated H-X9-DG protein
MGLLFPYVNNVAAYKCPLDTNAFGGVPTVRSISMNCYMNPIDVWEADVPGQITNFRKSTSITRPASTFLIMDENPATVNAGWFVVCSTPTAFWGDAPTFNHDGGAPISFCDGHVEIKKWTDKNILTSPVQIYAPADPTSSDLQWLQTRATY